MTDTPLTLDLATLDRIRSALRQVGDPDFDLDLGGVVLRMHPARHSLPAPEAPPPSPETQTIQAQGIGILRLCPLPSGDALAPIGATIAPGQIIAQLQVGAALFPIPASCGGRVADILAQDGDLVGYDTPILSVTPL